MKKRLFFLATLALVTATLVWASPDDYKYRYYDKSSYAYREVKGWVKALDWQARYIVIGGQKLALARSVWFEYGPPKIDSYVEAKLRPEGNSFVV